MATLSEIKKEIRPDWYRCPIEKEVLRKLCLKSDKKGFVQAGGHLAIFLMTGGLTYVFWHNSIWYAFLAMLFAIQMINKSKPMNKLQLKNVGGGSLDAIKNSIKKSEIRNISLYVWIWTGLMTVQWITAANIEIQGTAGNEVYSLQSAPCGSTAKYCLGADAHNITTLTGTSYKLPIFSPGNGNSYHNTGTSFVAPMISGAIAILAEAFPNQSPEIWADRLLASADNDWFTHNGGAVTFGNGIQHGYSTSYGHGILDIYAALQPITSSAYTASMRVANSEGKIVTIPVIISNIRTSSSFGDAIKNALKNKTGYFYDGLDGGFKYDLSSHALIQETDSRPFKLEQEFALLGKNFDKHKVNLQKGAKNSFTEIKDDQNFFATLHASALPIQSFTGENAPNYLGFHSEQIPSMILF